MNEKLMKELIIELREINVHLSNINNSIEGIPEDFELRGFKQ